VINSINSNQNLNIAKATSGIEQQFPKLQSFHDSNAVMCITAIRQVGEKMGSSASDVNLAVENMLTAMGYKPNDFSRLKSMSISTAVGNELTDFPSGRVSQALVEQDYKRRADDIAIKLSADLTNKVRTLPQLGTILGNIFKMEESPTN
jgi:hypothetical protein